jgi:hypothetical protein
MKRQTVLPLKNLQLSLTNEPITQLVRQVDSGRMELNPPYQRPDVWTMDQRINLIHSVMTSVPIPAIITNFRGYKTKTYRAVIDGKQRLTTLSMWMSDHFMVPATWFEADEIERITCVMEQADAVTRFAYGDDTGPYVRYGDLTDHGQMRFDIASMPVAMAHGKTVRVEAEIYLRVNGYGTPQTDDDMANAARVADGE